MSKNKDLAAALSDKHGLSKQDAEKFVSAMFELVNSALSKEKLVKVKGLGTFKVISVAPRKSVDVNTGEPIVIEGRDKISFTPDASLRDEVNKPFAQFETVVVNDGVDFSEIDKKFSEEQEKEQKEELPVENKESTVPPVPEKESSVIAEEKAKATVEEKIEPIAEGKEEQIAEKKVEPVPKEKVEPVTEEKEEQIAEEKVEPVTEKEEEPIAEQEIEEVKEEVQQEVHQEVKDEVKEEVKEEVSAEQHRLRYVLVACAVVIVLCLAGGAYLFSQLQKRDNRIANLEAQVLAKSNKQSSKPKAAAHTKATSSQQAQQNKEVLTKEILTASADNQKVPTVQEEPKVQETPKSKETQKVQQDKPTKEQDNNTQSTKYESDPRIRTGAYNIVGIDQTVTVKAGQTLMSISKFYLGPGMECYVEAVNNGKTEFKAGDKIKIPSLKHKKKK